MTRSETCPVFSLLAATMLAACAGCAHAGGADSNPQTPEASVMSPETPEEDAFAKRLASSETAVRREALIAVIRQRDATIGCALRLAHEPDDGKTYWGKKECGVRLLGELRVAEGVSLLLNDVGFQPATRFGDPCEYEGLPCVEALIQIGSPAAKEIWSKRLAVAGKDTLPLYLMVLKHVWGKEICTLLVEKRLKSQPPPQGLEKENLEAALKYFEKLEQ